jgi:hypothetical protein
MFMSDELITVGITILSTFFGFALVKVSDWLTTRKERKQTQAILIFKLYKLRATISAIRDDIQKLDKITQLHESKLIHEVLIKSEVQKEFLKVEPLFEKLFIPNIQDPTIFVHFSNLNIYVNNLFTIGDSEIDNFVDKKPGIMVSFIVTIDAFNKIIDDVSKWDTFF